MDDPVFLTVVIDTDPVEWAKRAKVGGDQQITLNDLIKSVVIFCNTFALLHRKNKLLILGNHPDGVCRIYPRQSGGGSEEALISSSCLLPYFVANGILKSGAYPNISDTKFKIEPNTDSIRSALANALSVCLCGTI